MTRWRARWWWLLHLLVLLLLVQTAQSLVSVFFRLNCFTFSNYDCVIKTLEYASNLKHNMFYNLPAFVYRFIIL